jgi:hypothetical protein
MYIPSLTTTLQAKTSSFLSDKCPVLHTISSLVMDCNLINNKYNNQRSKMFYSIPMSSSFGNIITVGPSPLCLCSMTAGIYSYILLEFFDAANNPVNVRDSDITVTLVLHTHDEVPNHIVGYSSSVYS